MNNVYDGSIILMHDIYPSTAEAVKKIVPKLIDDGYQVVTVSEMVTIKNNGKEIEAGQQYIDYNTINNNT
jgi:peptidoglycan/xylan/chitin deacetylase (PgdA/CDA1 family)